jgi:hypothetical protein
MRILYFFLLFNLFFISSQSLAWELQQFTSCDRVSISLSKYSMCIPDEYYIDRVNNIRVALISKSNEEVISFHDSGYAQYKDKLIDDVMTFKKSFTKYGYKIYVHQSNESLRGGVYIYTWTIPLVDDDFFMVIQGFSQEKIEQLLKEIVSSKKRKMIKFKHWKN